MKPSVKLIAFLSIMDFTLPFHIVFLLAEDLKDNGSHNNFLAV